MKAFQVKYDTEIYRVFSELVLAPSEAAIPERLAEKSNKNFIPGHPACEIKEIREVAIDDLSIRDLTVGQLFELIDSRLQSEQPTVATAAALTVATDIQQAISGGMRYDQLQEFMRREKRNRILAVDSVEQFLHLDQPERGRKHQAAKKAYDQSTLNIEALQSRINELLGVKNTSTNEKQPTPFPLVRS